MIKQSVWNQQQKLFIIIIIIIIIIIVVAAVVVVHESELWKSKAGVLVYKDRGGLKIDLATGQN